MDLKTLTDEELGALRQQVMLEQERRQALASYPSQIDDMVAKYLEGGGDPTLLNQKVV